MAEKIEPGLFVRLMRGTATARKDLLEFIGTSAVSADGVVSKTGVSEAAMVRALEHKMQDRLHP